MALSVSIARVGHEPVEGVAAGARKGFTAGTHRLVPPRETVERVRHFMPVMGITRIANVTGLDTVGIPVVMVSRPNSRSISVSQGKGLDVDAAKASGLMESIESYHAERIALPLKLGSVEDLRYSHSLVDVDRLSRLVDSRFTPYKQLLWVGGRDLLGDREVWVPYELVHLNYTLPLPSGHGCFVASSNGLASGNHRLEAISHAICEVVERDAVTLWHLLDEDGQGQTRIDLGTVDDPGCRDLLDKYAAADVEVGVWDVTSDVGIPAFLCRIVQRAAPPANGSRPASGMGCHASRDVALARALTEAAQSRLTFISGARDDLWRAGNDEFLDAETHASWLSCIERGEPCRSFADVDTWNGDRFEDDVDWACARLASVGIGEVVVVDLTKEEFGIPVVRVVIPGLEGVDSSSNYAPGERARARLRGDA